MFFILLRVFFQTAFAQLLRYGQVRSGRVMVVALVNYGFATLLCFLMAALWGRLGFSRVTLFTGIAGGTTYLLALLLVLPAMQVSGVSIAVAVLQIAQLLPAVFAMAVFGERPSPAQVAGLLLALAALVILSFTTSAPDPRRGARFSPILVPLFFVTGSSGIAMKTFQEYGPPSEQMSFNAILFAAATLSTVIAMSWGSWLAPLAARGSWLAARGRERRKLECRAASHPLCHDAGVPAALWPRSGQRQGRATTPGSLPRFGAGGDSGGAEPRAERAPWRLPALVGLLMGTANTAQLVCLMLALAREPAILVFPVASALSLVANAIASVYLWQEWLRPAAWLGLTLALVATVLLNIHPTRDRTTPEGRTTAAPRRTEFRSSPRSQAPVGKETSISLTPATRCLAPATARRLMTPGA